MRALRELLIFKDFGRRLNILTSSERALMKGKRKPHQRLFRNTIVRCANALHSAFTLTATGSQ